VAASTAEIYRAVLTLSRSLAGRNDLESLLSGLADSLRSIVPFEYAALVLHDRQTGQMRGYILSERGAAGAAQTVLLPIDRDPAGWVWLNQRPLVIPALDAETRWPEFQELGRSHGVHALVDVPLTSGENRLGALGFGCPVPYDPTADELAFLERVASEFAVAVEAFLAKQEVSRERDRLRTLFDITKALVSKLSPDELFEAIAQQLARVVQLDHAVLTLRNEAGGLDTYALHSPLPELSELRKPFHAEGMPAADVLATGKPVVAYAADADRYPNPVFQRGLQLGLRSVCSVPLTTPNGTIGTLGVSRRTEERWKPEDVDFLSQVGSQIGIAVQNALTFRQLNEIKERLASEKLYLEDEIRFDQNIGNMVGEGPAFQSVPEEPPGGGADGRNGSHPGRNRNRERTSRESHS